ncbi:DUF4302 domain-containing protein [Sphingobacterium litopenaei]|uniref:DUF4302 domain-containing protein n=1 Tax=Sphingobacterium litopenaei TaxID=2763500 RepID=A0ABR7YHC8_9SPHI|nr:DUF4302 domain-containing protein [Sphingobacterium litopenaei]MBD1430666.1 DUF4302 domain-containing protein [Sphingobacterium litopenaei]
MKNIILFITSFLLFTGCHKHEAENLFDALPEERINEKLNELRSKLLESPSGWKATLNTGTTTTKGAYNFYINFEDVNNYSIQGDLNETSSTEWQIATYRIIWAMNASLVFDTFSYLTYLQEPSSSYGGTAPHGYRSDIEFEYIRSSEDSVFLKGKKYQHDFLLTKISTSDKQALDNKELKSKIDQVTAFFANNLNSYFQIDNSDIKYAVSIDRIGRQIILNWMENDKVESVISSFAYSLEGIDIFKPINVKGNIISKIVINNNNAEAKSTSSSFIIKNNPTPILPITSLFGSNAAFNAIVINGPNMPVGITSQFNTLWQGQLNLYANNNATMVSCIFKLNNSTTASLLVRFNIGGTVYLAQSDYNYTLVEGILKLSAPISTNGNYNNGWVTTDIKNYFSAGEFKIDYAVSTNPDVVNIGGLYKVNNPSSFFYGKLEKN